MHPCEQANIMTCPPLCQLKANIGARIQLANKREFS